MRLESSTMPIENSTIKLKWSTEKLTLKNVSTGARCCVQKPGSYTFPQDNTITLLQAISLAGGFTGYASVNGTKIVRTAPDGKKITVDPKVNDVVNGKRKDTDLQPDDLVFVPERIF